MSTPQGMRWRLTSPLTHRSRNTRYETFMRQMSPGPTDRVLDVGVTDTIWRASNFLESRYPWPEQITAVAPHPVPNFSRAHPAVDFVAADGRHLPFADASFDIGFSNAVIEHVGSRAQQQRFVEEMVRTCRRVFICTPNAAFPIDPHTLLPFAHWLPRDWWHRVLRMSGNGRWASEDHLNPLSATEFLNFFSEADGARLVSQRMFLMTSVLIAVTERRPPTGT